MGILGSALSSFWTLLRTNIRLDGCIHVFCAIANCSSHMLTSDVDLSQTAQAAQLFLSDGVIVTGATTASAANVAALKGKSK